MPNDQNGRYWDGALAALLNQGGPWRAFCDHLHHQLIHEWLGDVTADRVLKTDLFDEAAGVGLAGILARRFGEVHGIDVSGAVAATAANRNPSGRFLLSDVRKLPYPDASFDAVVSNSTLDHFHRQSELVEAVEELYRVLKPGGRMLITFDNLANPVIALRRILPFRWLNRLGLVPYFVGESVTPAGLRRLLDNAGFTVARTRALMHVPRVLAVPVCVWLSGRSPETLGRLLGFMGSFERLATWPTSNLTGYYAAALAIKPAAPAGLAIRSIAADGTTKPARQVRP